MLPIVILQALAATAVQPAQEEVVEELRFLILQPILLLSRQLAEVEETMQEAPLVEPEVLPIPTHLPGYQKMEETVQPPELVTPEVAAEEQPKLPMEEMEHLAVPVALAELMEALRPETEGQEQQET
jgi:hypothetical protein